MLYLSGASGLAIERISNVVKLDSTFFPGHYYLGVAYLCAKRYMDAVPQLEEALRSDPDQPQPIAYLGYAQSMLGNRKEAVRLMEPLHEFEKTRYVPPYLFAIIHAGLGEADRATEALQKAYEARDDMMSLLKMDCVFEPLHSDPRFQQLVRRVGL